MTKKEVKSFWNTLLPLRKGTKIRIKPPSGWEGKHGIICYAVYNEKIREWVYEIQFPLIKIGYYTREQLDVLE